ncbi:hypothetical protein [Aeromonas taiwanensis]|uniref:hypothetical protein n=1 Tax=Aeromonas taiwanensis TaxID=633417 RepID=UPI003BA0A433
MTATVYVVHCIDTEGPLTEPLVATFERLKSIFGIDLPATPGNLARLQAGQLPLDGLEDIVAKTFHPSLLAYNDTWEKINAMLVEILSPDYRYQLPDSQGKGHCYSWFLLDLVGYSTNPRYRDLGWHKIFDRYLEASKLHGPKGDGFYFHHHPLPFSGAANHCATHYFATRPIVFETLARKILERGWFPSVYRPGFHTIRPDSHWLLEQFIPFDYSSQAIEDELNQSDLANGRFGDWRRAPRNWTPYHPAHDDYQVPGACRRWTTRCLNVGTRHRLLTQAHVDQAFLQARADEPSILAFTHHDFRDMRADINYVRGLLQQSQARYPDVGFCYANAVDAMRGALSLPVTAPIQAEQHLQSNVLSIRTEAPIFGPQPFLALETRDGRYLHDNLDIHIPHHAWSYVFDEQTIPLAEIRQIGWAANDAYGNTLISKLNLDTQQQEWIRI